MSLERIEAIYKKVDFSNANPFRFFRKAVAWHPNVSQFVTYLIHQNYKGVKKPVKDFYIDQRGDCEQKASVFQNMFLQRPDPLARKS